MEIALRRDYLEERVHIRISSDVGVNVISVNIVICDEISQYLELSLRPDPFVCLNECHYCGLCMVGGMVYDEIPRFLELVAFVERWFISVARQMWE